MNVGSEKRRSHVQLACPQDFRTSKVRMRSIVTADPWLRVVWRELIDAQWERGAPLERHIGRLSSELGVPPAELVRCLEILGPDDLGFLSSAEGPVGNARVSRELQERTEFRDRQREFGKSGGRPAWKREGPDSEGSAKATLPSSEGSAKATLGNLKGSGSESKGSLTSPSPSPSPSPYTGGAGGGSSARTESSAFGGPPSAPADTHPKIPKTTKRTPRSAQSFGLEEPALEAFRRFMAAYPEHGASGGRPGWEGAAKSWAKLTPEDWEPAIAGAKLEAKGRNGKETEYTKWPQGWLSERRWEHMKPRGPIIRRAPDTIEREKLGLGPVCDPLPPWRQHELIGDPPDESVIADPIDDAEENP